MQDALLTCSSKKNGITVHITVGGGMLCSISFSSLPERFAAAKRVSAGHPALKEAVKQVSGFLAGTSQTFDLPYELTGTMFQIAVWKQIARIPYGTTMSYGEIAAKIRRPGAVRAVGSACGKNPLPLLIPCHRVLAAGGKLGGFSGGVAIKKKLLRSEGIAYRE